jgi:hypothetical protein
MSLSWLLSQSRLIHICLSHMTLECFWELPTPMAWLGYPPLGLPRSCYSPKTQALINHTDTHHKLRQHSAQQLYTIIHISLTPHSHMQVEEGLLDPKSSVGHTNRYYFSVNIMSCEIIATFFRSQLYCRESDLAILSSPVTKTMYIFSKVYCDCMKCWKISSSVPGLSLMTHCEYRLTVRFQSRD